MLGERQKQAHALGRPATRAFSFSLPMFEHARDNIDHYRALAGGRGGVIALVGIRRIIADLARAEINPLGDKGSADFIGRDFIVQYVVGAFMSVLTGWLDAGAKLPPDRIDAMFQRLATRGVVRKAS